MDVFVSPSAVLADFQDLQRETEDVLKELKALTDNQMSWLERKERNFELSVIDEKTLVPAAVVDEKLKAIQSFLDLHHTEPDTPASSPRKSSPAPSAKQESKKKRFTIHLVPSTESSTPSAWSKIAAPAERHKGFFLGNKKKHAEPSSSPDSTSSSSSSSSSSPSSPSSLLSASAPLLSKQPTESEVIVLEESARVLSSVLEGFEQLFKGLPLKKEPLGELMTKTREIDSYGVMMSTKKAKREIEALLVSLSKETEELKGFVDDFECPFVAQVPVQTIQFFHNKEGIQRRNTPTRSSVLIKPLTLANFQRLDFEDLTTLEYDHRKESKAIDNQIKFYTEQYSLYRRKNTQKTKSLQDLKTKMARNRPILKSWHHPELWKIYHQHFVTKSMFLADQIRLSQRMCSCFQTMIDLSKELLEQLNSSATIDSTSSRVFRARLERIQEHVKRNEDNSKAERQKIRDLKKAYKAIKRNFLLENRVRSVKRLLEEDIGSHDPNRERTIFNSYVLNERFFEGQQIALLFSATEDLGLQDTTMEWVNDCINKFFNRFVQTFSIAPKFHNKVESLLQHAIHSRLHIPFMNYYCGLHRKMDESFHRGSVEVRRRGFSFDPLFATLSENDHEKLKGAINRLELVCFLEVPKDILEVLKRVMGQIISLRGCGPDMNMDQLLPLWVYVSSHAFIPFPVSVIEYVEDFLKHNTSDGKQVFCITTFKAAVHYVASLKKTP